MLQTAIAAIILVLSLYAQAHAEDPFNYGHLWHAWSPAAHDAYLQGFTDGINAAFWKAGESWLGSTTFYKKPEPEMVKHVREAVFPFFNSETLAKMISDLYKDSANTFIPLDRMTYIARDKLKGGEIGAALKAARKDAVENHLLMQHMKQE